VKGKVMFAVSRMVVCVTCVMASCLMWMALKHVMGYEVKLVTHINYQTVNCMKGLMAF
jgi:hypothetical protein